MIREATTATKINIGDGGFVLEKEPIMVKINPGEGEGSIALKAIALWDLDNLCLPKGKKYLGVVKKIKDLPGKFGYCYDKVNMKIYAYGNKHAIQRHVEAELKDVSQELEYEIVEDVHDEADQAIQIKMFEWKKDNPPPVIIVLITSDSDFAYLCGIVTAQKYVLILIACQDYCSDILRCRADYFLAWEDLIDAEPVKMDKFTVDDLHRVMDKKHNIRNMSVIGHVKHGNKSSDVFISMSG